MNNCRLLNPANFITIGAMNLYMEIVIIGATVIASFSAFFSWKLAARLAKTLKSDEILIAGPLSNPALLDSRHSRSLIYGSLFNKSHRKAFVNQIRCFDFEDTEGEIDISWADVIDNVGNTINPTGLLGIVNNSIIYILRTDGQEFKATKVEIHHSFNDSPIILTFDPYAEFVIDSK